MTIRPITQADDKDVAAVIRSVLIEHNVPKVGTAYADPQLEYMTEAYSGPRAAYFVIDNDRTIIGGAGVAPLEGGPEGVCELQKMYFLPEARGLGLGQQMIDRCIETARSYGFSECYLETMPYMEAAQKLYKKAGFTYLDAPMGSTGHTSCPVWMIKKL
ncbi:MAG TPA: GNAT family N-acetyltransferase [Flavobacterium sp.]|jgi:putative acetyltransferase